MSEEPRAIPRAPIELPVGPPPTLASAPISAARPDVATYARALLRSMRPRQWTKNAIVYMALLFSIGERWHPADPSSWLPLLGWSTVTFFLFCLVSSADYLVNDVVDRESDAVHPEKRKRPIVAGIISPRDAVYWAAGMWAAALIIAFALAPWLSWHVGAVLAGYIVLMLAYTFVLKHIVLLDMMAIGAGFVLRAMAGAFAIDTPVSPWLYVVTALGALFLIVHKRRAELNLLQDGAADHRPILEQYSSELLDQMTSLVTASTLIAYGLYTFTAPNLPENHAMMLTIPFVLYGLLRYLYLVYQQDKGGSPEEVLLSDWPLLIDIGLWVSTAAIVLAVNR